MISTITTSTVTTITTTVGFGVVMGLAAVIALLAFLFIRELATASKGTNHTLLAKFLDIGIVPLFITFIAIVVMNIVEVLL